VGRDHSCFDPSFLPEEAVSSAYCMYQGVMVDSIVIDVM
jgi:hypothetical protein